jgi:hypothetical protein
MIAALFPLAICPALLLSHEASFRLASAQSSPLSFESQQPSADADLVSTAERTDGYPTLKLFWRCVVPNHVYNKLAVLPTPL